MDFGDPGARISAQSAVTVCTELLLFKVTLRYQPPFKTGIFQNLSFCDDRIKLLKSVLLKKKSIKNCCFCENLLDAKVFSVLIIFITR